uniref:40S ribosomal protein S6 n=1 Tax=Equus asinus TaxID=9793 RepID=A0A8C4KP10_EQUAS
MKMQIFPVTNCQRLTEMGDEQKLPTFVRKLMATEVAADALSEGWKVRKIRKKLQNMLNFWPREWETKEKCQEHFQETDAVLSESCFLWSEPSRK